jgi:hypothetical protein
MMTSNDIGNNGNPMGSAIEIPPISQLENVRPGVGSPEGHSHHESDHIFEGIRAKAQPPDTAVRHFSDGTNLASILQERFPVASGLESWT